MNAKVKVVSEHVPCARNKRHILFMQKLVTLHTQKQQDMRTTHITQLPSMG